MRVHLLFRCAVDRQRRSQRRDGNSSSFEAPVDLEWLNFLDSLGWQTAIAVDNALLFEGMQRSNFDMELAYEATIEGWSKALDLRDKETEGHTQRVTEYNHETCAPDGREGRTARSYPQGSLVA